MTNRGALKGQAGNAGQWEVEVGGFGLCNEKRDSLGRWAQQDRWAVARLEGAALCVVADGISQWDFSSAIADLACESFVDRFLQLHSSGAGLDGHAMVSQAFLHAAERCHAERVTAQDCGGAALVAAYMTAEGQVWTAQAGDARIWGRKNGRWQPLTPEGHTGSTGGLTAYMGKDPSVFDDLGAFVPENMHSDVDIVVAASDGLYEPLINLGTLETELAARTEGDPYVTAHALAHFAVSLSSRDNISLTIMKQRPRSDRDHRERRDLSWLVLASAALVSGLLCFFAGVLAAQLGALPAPPGSAQGPAHPFADVAAVEDRLNRGCRDAASAELVLAFVSTAQRPAVKTGAKVSRSDIRGARRALEKACPSLASSCVDGRWWTILTPSDSEWRWGRALDCLGAETAIDLSPKSPWVECKPAGKKKRVHCQR